MRTASGYQCSNGEVDQRGGRMPALIPDLLYRNGRFEPDLAVEFPRAAGGEALIARVIPACDVTDPDVQRLAGRALLPGFVNAHSHAFQRVIRGRTQWAPAGPAVAAADFWSWREAMYAAALGLSPDDVFTVSRLCFLEMLRAGYTSVGEFHYLHRDPAGRRYAVPAELAARVIAAAEAVGLRICLLNTAYAGGGIGEPLRPEQRRFATPDLEAYLTESAELAHAVKDRPLVSVGVAPHSLRAVPRAWLAAIHALAYGYDMPFHMHVSEQPAEVSASLKAYGSRPVEVLAEEGVVDGHLTAIHATHMTFREVALFGAPGATICACPTTERDLGDGLLPAADLIGAGARLALGSDSQTVIDPFEEMRLVEYHERLRRLERIVLGETQSAEAGVATTGRREVAPGLIAMATAGGASALRLAAGAIEPGTFADLVAIDLEHLALAGWTADTLPALLALCAPAAVVSDVWVGGVQRIVHGHHAAEEPVVRSFRAVASRLAG